MSSLIWEMRKCTPPFFFFKENIKKRTSNYAKKNNRFFLWYNFWSYSMNAVKHYIVPSGRRTKMFTNRLCLECIRNALKFCTQVLLLALKFMNLRELRKKIYIYFGSLVEKKWVESIIIILLMVISTLLELITSS